MKIIKVLTPVIDNIIPELNKVIQSCWLWYEIYFNHQKNRDSYSPNFFHEKLKHKSMTPNIMNHPSRVPPCCCSIPFHTSWLASAAPFSRHINILVCTSSSHHHHHPHFLFFSSLGALGITWKFSTLAHTYIAVRHFLLAEDFAEDRTGCCWIRVLCSQYAIVWGISSYLFSYLISETVDLGCWRVANRE